MENPAGFRVCGFCARPLASTAARPETRKLVTLVFADVSGSTALGEQFDAEVVRRVMLEFFEIAREVLERHGGMVEKFIGDAVMAAFGIPRVHEDDALRAVSAAAELRDHLRAFGERTRGRYGTRITVRMGVNTGEVVAGEAASAQAFASGDAVNLAARLEQAAPPGEILLGESTVRLVRHAVAVEEVQPLELKGKSQAVPAWRLIHVRPGGMRARSRPDSALVGREDELALLLAAWDTARRERAVQLVTIVAPAGTGKTRLTMELAAWLRGEAQVLTGSCLPYGEGITFWPISEIVRQAAAVDVDDDPQDIARSKLAQLVQHEESGATICAQLEPMLGLSSRVVSIEETFWSVRMFLEALASRNPLLVILDDLHWAEEALLDLIDYLAAQSGGVPLLLVCATRPDLLEGRPAPGGRRANAATLELEPLTPYVSAALMRLQLGRGDLPRELAKRILETAAGNPLFIQELVRMLVDDGIVIRHGPGWRATAAVRELAMPATIQALLAARLDQLGDGERDAAQRAAVVGHVFTRSAVSELCDERDRATLPAVLESLRHKQFILPEAATLEAGQAFRFGHVLMRDAAYGGLVKSMRAELHERYAVWLGNVRTGSAVEHDEILGYHFEQAAVYRRDLGDFVDGKRVAAEASARLAAAGRRALASGDLPVAANLLSRAANILTADDPQRLGIRLEAIPPLIESGRIEQADEGLAEILAGAGENPGGAGGGRMRLAAAAWRVVVDQTTSRVTFEGGEAAIQAWLTDCREHDDPAGQAAALGMLAGVRLHTGRSGEAEELWWSAAEHAARAADHRTEAEALAWLLICAVVGPTPVRIALERCDAVSDRAGAARKVQAFVAMQRGVLEAMQGHFAPGRRLVARGRRELDELGLAYATGCAFVAADIERMASDHVAAEAFLRPALARLSELGDRSVYSTMAGLLAHVLCAQGRLEEASAFVASCQVTTSDDDVLSQALWRSAQAKVAAREGDDALALQLAEDALALVAATDWLFDHAERFADLAEVHALAGRAAEAVAALDQADDLYRRKGCVAGLDLTRSRRAALGL